MARSSALIASFVVALAIPAAVEAEEWPSRPIRFIVPYPAGGSTDVGARAIADSLSRSLGQQIVVENKSGASGNVGFEAAAHSAPDGYTVLIGPDQVASAPHVFKVTFDPRKDFAPVIQLSRQPVVLAVHPKLGVASVAELDRAGEATSRPELRDFRRRVATAYDGRVVCADCGDKARARALSQLMEHVEIWRKMAQYRGVSSRQICPGIAEVSRSADSSPAAIYAGRVRACNLGARRKDISATLVSADNVESARRAHHLQNPQNRPWYRVCNRLADRLLGEMGESGASRMEAEWPTPSRSRADGARRPRR